MADDPTPANGGPIDDGALHRGSDSTKAADVEPSPTRGSLVASKDLPFESLDAPLPLSSAPPTKARWLGFSAILLGGGLGAIIGWGTGDVLGGSEAWAAGGAMVGAVFCASGVGLVVSLTLRAMNEWNAVHHPEADRSNDIIGEHR